MAAMTFLTASFLFSFFSLFSSAFSSKISPVRWITHSECWQQHSLKSLKMDWKLIIAAKSNRLVRFFPLMFHTPFLTCLFCLLWNIWSPSWLWSFKVCREEIHCVIMPSAKLHISEWPIIVTSPRHTPIIMLFNQHMDMQHLSVWWIILVKQQCSLTQISTNLCTKSERKKAVCVHLKSLRSFVSTAKTKSVTFWFLVSVQ